MVDQGNAVRRRLLIGLPQPGRPVEQHVARRPFADRLHLIEEHVVGSVLQRQQFGDGAAAEGPEYRGSDHTGLGHRVIRTGINYILN